MIKKNILGFLLLLSVFCLFNSCEDDPYYDDYGWATDALCNNTWVDFYTNYDGYECEQRLDFYDDHTGEDFTIIYYPNGMTDELKTSFYWDWEDNFFDFSSSPWPPNIQTAPERQSVPGRSAFLFVLWRRPASFRRWPVLRPYRPRVKPPLLGVGLTSCKTVCKNLPLYSLKQRHQSWHTCWYISTYCLALALQLKSHSMARFTSCCQPSGYSYPAFARSTAFSMSWAL